MKMSLTERMMRSNARRHGGEALHWIRFAAGQTSFAGGTPERVEQRAIETAQRAWRWALRSMVQHAQDARERTATFTCPRCAFSAQGQACQEFFCRLCLLPLRRKLAR